ncbi:ankyrin repeat domain-containing protein [Paraglaciecola aquimarina]|uniref:Ankyrin repeat domain-containing protein n=1 Tax=Paraglaciecola aquimarina TaxID=1235557 RepID=A0ABU3SXE5_9ALTE|nr:ankyrin repeat domain-containing protein [Paraglaciecola aquimarina]MDU0354690.1 ankyrin repeat domain-containing protein [Paraglaciecola aquimarina]
MSSWLDIFLDDTTTFILSLTTLLLLITLLGKLLLRYQNKRRFIEELDVLYLRSFSANVDSYTLRVINRANTQEMHIGLVLPPGSMLASWDPYFVAFGGNPFFPFKNLPILFKESSDNWRAEMITLIEKAACIIVDIRKMGKGTEWEIATIKRLKLEYKTIVLAPLSFDIEKDNPLIGSQIIKFDPLLYRFSKETKQQVEALSNALKNIKEESEFTKLLRNRRRSELNWFTGIFAGSLCLIVLVSALYYRFLPSTLEQAIFFNNKHKTATLTQSGEAEKTTTCSMPMFTRLLAEGDYANASLLLKNGADPYVTFTTDSILPAMQENALSWAIKSEHYAAVEFLLEQKINPYKRFDRLYNNGTATAMAYAEQLNNQKMLTLLKENTTFYNDMSYWPPLAVAIETKDYQAAESLLQNGEDPNLVFRYSASEDFESPLLSAIESKDLQAIALLFKYGADPNLKKMDGKYTKTLYSLFGNNTEVTAYRFKLSMFGSALGTKDMSIIRLFLDHGADAKQGLALYSAQDEHILIELYKAVLNQGTGALDEYVDSAITKQKYVALEWLLQQGINPNDEINGEYPLLTAVSKQDSKATELLLQYGAKPTTPTTQTTLLISTVVNTPLTLAVNLNNIDITELLLQHGAKPERVVSAGFMGSESRSAIDIATSRSQFDILSLLQKYHPNND